MDTLLKAGDTQVEPTLPRQEDTLLPPGVTPLLLELTPLRPEDTLLRQEATHLQQVDTPKLQADFPLRQGATLPLLEDTIPNQEGTPNSLEQVDTPPCHQQVEAGDQLQVDTERREELHRVTPPAPPRDRITQQAPHQDRITHQVPPLDRTTQQPRAPPTRGTEGGTRKLLLSLKVTGVQSKTSLGLTH